MNITGEYTVNIINL